MKRKALKLHYIILMAFCQALAFYYFATPAKAASNEITITCPTEATVNTEISCTVTVKTTSEIDTINAELSLSNLNLKSFTPESGWTSSNSSTSISINIKASTKKSNTFQLGTIILTPIKSDVSGTVFLNNITFENEGYYSFNAVGQESSIKITPAPLTPTCATDEELVNGVCIKKIVICNENEELIDGKCVKKITECAEDEELIDGECTKKITECAEDEELIDEECVKKKVTCKTGEELINGKCVEKITTPTCNTDEILENNKCIKKPTEPDYLLIGLIASGSILFIVIIILLVIFFKKKKPSNKNGYLGSFGKGAKTGNLATPQGFTSKDSKGFGIGTGQTVQTGYNQPTVTQPTATLYDNGTFLARSGETVEIGTQPKENTDPKLRMIIKNPNENVGPINEPSSSNPLTNQISQGATVDNHDDPKLQYNFSEYPTAQIQQPQAQQPQNPIISTYDVATQAAAQPEQPTQQVIQATIPATQQATPTTAPLIQQRPANFAQQTTYRQTRAVPLTAPTDPTVFES